MIITLIKTVIIFEIFFLLYTGFQVRSSVSTPQKKTNGLWKPNNILIFSDNRY